MLEPLKRDFLELGAGLLAAGALPALGTLMAGCGEAGPGDAGVTPPEAPASSPALPSAPAPVPAPPPPTATSTGALVTELEAVAPVVAALQYVHESPVADRRCGNCQLYTPGAEGRGRCQLFAQGLVRETGWCASWIPRTS